MARHIGRLKLGSKPAQLYVRLSIILLSQRVNHVSSGIIRHYLVAFICLHFCLDTKLLNSFEELCIMRVAAIISFARELNPFGRSVHWPREQSVHQWPRILKLNPRTSHTKDSKIVLDASLLNTQHYKVRIKGKWSNPVKRVVPSPTCRCSSYWKASFRVTLDYSRQLYFIYIYIYIYIYI